MLYREEVMTLLMLYRRAADRADDVSDSDRQNKAADQVNTCYKKLKATEEGKSGLMELMSDPSPHVRGWAAAHSLQWNPSTAREVLERLRNDNVFPYSFDAEMTLEEFDKGRLSFDF